MSDFWSGYLNVLLFQGLHSLNKYVNRADCTVIEILEGQNMKKNTFQNKNNSFWIPIKKNKVNICDAKIKKHPVTFQESLRITLIIGQAFSLLPVNGILSKASADVRFQWTSWKCVYAFLSLIGQIFITVMCIFKVAHSETTLSVTTPVIFYSTTCITMIMFFRVARNWPKLVRNISYAEEMDPSYNHAVTYKCIITCAAVLFLALVEHILSLLSAFAGAMTCYPNKNLYEAFVNHFYPWVFNFLPYTPILGVLTQFLHFQSTFIWNFSDLFVICTSYYLTSRLEHVNKKLLLAQGKNDSHRQKSNLCKGLANEQTVYLMLSKAVAYGHQIQRVAGGLPALERNGHLAAPKAMLTLFYAGFVGRGGGRKWRFPRRAGRYLPEIFWRTARENYGRATQLVRSVDDVISGVVFISFANNLFFICLQLFNTLEDGIKGTGDCNSKAKKTTILGGYEAATYFLFSLVYLITRSVAVSLIASQVNTASTVPAPVLYDVPSPVYCLEVQRFLDQVHGDNVALSGLQFFSVTRSLLLTVAGTIVTYELVMFQFNSPQDGASTNATTTANPPL